MRDAPVLPAAAEVLAVGEDGEPCVFRIGERALGFTGHPGTKTAMVEDLVMEFEEGPEDPARALEALRDARVAIEDALVQVMTGVVQVLGLMEP